MTVEFKKINLCIRIVMGVLTVILTIMMLRAMQILFPLMKG